MVGVSRDDIIGLSLWLRGLSAPARLSIVVGLTLLASLTIWAVLSAQADARLVKIDPDDTPSHAALMREGVERGRGLFKTHCAACHGPEGQGRYTLGAANLTDKDWLYGRGDVSDIENVVLYGIRAPNSRTWRLADMPAFAEPVPYPREPSIKPLKPSDIDDVMQFMRSLQGRSADPQAASRGAEIYSNEGGCYDCHAHDARGDDAIGAPNLTDSIWLYGNGDAKWIYDSIASGRAGVMPAWVDRLSPAQIRSLSLYVYSLSHGSAQPKPSLP